MFHARRPTGVLTLLACGALLLSACANTDPADDPTASDPESIRPAETITYAYEQEFHSYNNNTTAENATRNAAPLQRVRTGFWFYGDKGEIVPDRDFEPTRRSPTPR